MSRCGKKKSKAIRELENIFRAYGGGSGFARWRQTAATTVYSASETTASAVAADAPTFKLACVYAIALGSPVYPRFGTTFTPPSKRLSLSKT